MSPSRLKFLVDVGVGTGVEELLREHGYDTKTITSIDAKMDDLDITTRQKPPVTASPVKASAVTGSSFGPSLLAL